MGGGIVGELMGGRYCGGVDGGLYITCPLR